MSIREVSGFEVVPEPNLLAAFGCDEDPLQLLTAITTRRPGLNEALCGFDQHLLVQQKQSLESSRC